LQNFNKLDDKKQIIIQGKNNREQLSKEFVRVLKYGEEMPDWVKYPYVIYNINSTDLDDRLNYHMPGGMTIKPDKDTKSHFIPWYHVIVADVGAMYPTILKAMNIGADTVRICPNSDDSNELIWLKKLPKKFLDSNFCNFSEINEDDSFADKGYKLDIIIDNKPGVINCAMTGIMSMISKVKKELKETKKSGDKPELERLKMMYQSIKGARNAGTHGILSAPNVSGRQFNLWGAAAITTKGQMILADTLDYLEKKGIRVVYGDTDGIYLGCSRSMGNLPNFSNALNIFIQDAMEDWLSNPEDVLSSIKDCNTRWQAELNYPDFELEPEIHDCMIFVKHKNYLIFDEKNGKIEINTKGNNFKGSDKANIARKILRKIMINVLKENSSWTDEKKARIEIKKSITNNTKKILLDFDLSKVKIDDLTLIQSVKPSNQYKKNQNGSMSTFGKRAVALEQLLNKSIKSRMKLKFVITKKHLPGISNPSKSGVKPIDYMYPIELLKDVKDIDLKWYKKMIENYIQGAFALHDIEVTEQKGLDAWM
jgi:DNA polymerase elongation subunit (family B)